MIKRDAFTLIEVMVAVVIISVVFLALIQMYANNIHIFSKLTQTTKINQYASLLIANHDYGWEKKNLTLYDLVDDFKIEDDLRRELKSTKVKIIYETTKQVDMNDELNTDMILEIGKTIVKINDSSVTLLRVRIE